MDSRATLHMMSKRDLTPEEQGTIQKSNDPSVITANGIARATEEGTQYVSMIRTRLFKFNYGKNHPRYSHWVHCAKKPSVV